MSTISECKFANHVMQPYIKYYGDEYFKKGWFGYKPIAGPDGKMGSGAMARTPHFKLKRGDIFVRRGSDYIPGWGTVAGNLTYTNDFEHELDVVLSQPEIECVFWVNAESGIIYATRFQDENDN